MAKKMQPSRTAGERAEPAGLARDPFQVHFRSVQWSALSLGAVILSRLPTATAIL